VLDALVQREVISIKYGFTSDLTGWAKSESSLPLVLPILGIKGSY
jgi:hypothetical protein